MDTEKPSSQKKRKPKTPKKVNERYLYNAGLYYLKRYTASIEHFKGVMRRKIKKSCAHHTDQDFGACLPMLEAATARLIDEGFLNDEAYTRGMVTSLRRKGKSQKLIAKKLRSKGLATDLVRDELEHFDETFVTPDRDGDISADFKAALIHARKKRLGPYNTKPASDELYKRGLGSLARAGFSYETAKRVMDLPPEDLQNMSMA